MSTGSRGGAVAVAVCLMTGAAGAIGGLAGCGAGEQSEQPKPAITNDRPTSDAAATALPDTPDDFTTEEGFTPLALGDFEVYHGDKEMKNATWAGKNGYIYCFGDPRGYLYSKKSHRNFTLRAEYHFDNPHDPQGADQANTGFLVYITGPHKVWPVCLEVQGKHVEMGQIKANGRRDVLDSAGVRDDEPARQKARKPVGQWNAVEIVSRDGALTSFVNGAKICESKAGELREGPIGLQSEGFRVQFRRLRIRDDP